MSIAPLASGMDVRAIVEHIPYLRRYARALTQNLADADDLVQNSLLRAIGRIASFEEGTNLRAWLITIMHNFFIDGFRKKKKAIAAGEENVRASQGLHTPANQMFKMQIKDLELALGRLSPAQRSTILLLSLEGMSYDEIARVTCVPVGTVRSRISRARRSLIDAVEGRYLNEKVIPLSQDKSYREVPASMTNPRN